LINGFAKGDWLEALLFAVSVAVGLTPEMLPMIVSANLAKGALAMAKHKVVVKRLNAIQNFGAMDVLCTDKTGTLTQDRIILEHHGSEHVPLDEAERRELMAIARAYNEDGFRVIAVATREFPRGETKRQYAMEDERDLVLRGFLAFLDPPKETAGPAIAALREH